MSGSAVLRFRWAIALAWLVAGVVLLPLAPGVEHRLEVSARILGSESAAVERLLADRFESPFARNAILVLSGVTRSDDPRIAGLAPDHVLRSVRELIA